MKTGPVNEQLQSLVAELQQRGHKDSAPLLIRLAADLSRPSRGRRVVNLSRINRFTKDGDTIVVPGKVLAAGDLSHSVTIAAWKFSSQAIEKIEKAKSKALTIDELLDGGVQGRKIRVIG